MGLRLFFLPNFPEATFIQGGTFIPDSRVCTLSLYSGLGATFLKILPLSNDCELHQNVGIIQESFFFEKVR